MNKETKKLLKKAESKGLEVRLGKTHAKVFGKAGLICVLSLGGKPPGPRNLKMAELAIRKAIV